MPEQKNKNKKIQPIWGILFVALNELYANGVWRIWATLCNTVQVDFTDMWNSFENLF